MAKIIDGTAIASAYRDKLAKEVSELIANGTTPGLAVILVGDDNASKIYVRNKARTCKSLGIYCERHILPAETDMPSLLGLIGMLNEKEDIHGILVQHPLPSHLDEKQVFAAISPYKDVDAFNEQNVGAIMLGDYRFLPGTPAGIIELIHSTGVEIAGANCVVAGRSNIVGKPMAMMLLNEHGTVTICHSHTKNLAEICRGADILICATGKANLFTGDMIKPGAVLIDVGINRDIDGKLCGDADFDSCAEIAGWITPVPGGVGPMTITMLMRNTVTAVKMSLQTDE